MAVALIESIFYSAVNTRLLGHILSSLAPFAGAEISSFLPPRLTFHLYAENVLPRGGIFKYSCQEYVWVRGGAEMS